MKQFSGFLLLTCFLFAALGGNASVQYHKSEKAKTELSVTIKAVHSADGLTTSLKFEAVMPTSYTMPDRESYLAVWCIGTPTGQLHESNIYNIYQVRWYRKSVSA